MKLKLARPLLALLGHEQRDRKVERDVILLTAQNWSSVVDELRLYFPELAERVLTSSGAVASGFILVVNGEVLPRGSTPAELCPQDELALIPGLAGGSHKSQR